MGATHRPWTAPAGRPPPSMIRVSTSARYRDVIDIAWGSRPRADRSFPFYCDLSQCVTRQKWGPSLGCQTRTSRFYDYQRDRMLTAKDMLLLQALPAADLNFSATSAGDLFSMAGEGMTCSCISMMMLAFFLNSAGDWWHSG